VLRALLPWLALSALAGLGALVGVGADRFALTALVLHAEPVLLVLAVWSIAAARWSGRLGLALALSAGTVLASAALRAPWPLAPAAADPPPWVSPVARCAAALRTPADTVRLLQWTLDGSEEPAAILDVVTESAANVVVLHGAPTPAVVDTIVSNLGGESRLHGSEGGATAVIAQGGFHPCGEGLQWSEAMDTPDGLTLAFVGVPPSTIFPLVVTRLPHPATTADWGARMDTASGRLLNVLAGLQGPSTVVVADASAPRTYRNLDGRMAAVGLSSAPVPPTFPAHLGPIPLLPLHPYTRVWAGPIWRLSRVDALGVPRGQRAPVLAVLDGPHRAPDRAPVQPPRTPLDEPTLENGDPPGP
jgi:hypothetical protein